MAYTANLLSTLLAGVHLPVVLVGSNYVLTDERANGNQNFSDAVDFIASRSYPGVYVIFSGRVYLGSRILQCRSFTDEYPTVSGADFARMENGKIIDCRYDEIFADHPDQIEDVSLKPFYRQSKYQSMMFEEPSRIGFNVQMDALNDYVVELSLIHISIQPG